MSGAELPAHDWREDVGRCICCWHWCTRCRQCKCQVKNRWRTKGTGCPGQRGVSSVRG